jgi:glycosyltransferase involved in cell wall biosynthesis
MSPARASDRTVRPRILRIITRLNVGGPATHVILADRGLRERGWETLLVHGIVEPDEAEVPLEGVDLPMRRLSTLARPIRPLADARALASIARAIRSYRPHVIHTHLSKAGLLGRSAAILTSSKAVRVHTFHGTVFGGYFGGSTSGMIQRAERFLGHRTDRILALSERQRQELLDYRIAPSERIRIVPLGLDLDRFAGIDRQASRAALGIPDDAVAVVAIGRLVPIKRIDRLLRAVAAAAERAPAIRLYLVGDGGERASLEALSASLGLGARVTVAGWSTDTPGWYAAADIVALTSDREGTPLALIEAASAGRATVASDVGGVADIVVDGETGIVVPPDNETALADALVRLAGDADLRERLGRAAPGHARGFAAKRLIDDLDNLYRQALAERREHL